MEVHSVIISSAYFCVLFATLKGAMPIAGIMQIIMTAISEYNYY